MSLILNNNNDPTSFPSLPQVNNINLSRIKPQTLSPNLSLVALTFICDLGEAFRHLSMDLQTAL